MISVDDLTFGYGPRQAPIVTGLTHAFGTGTLTVVTGPSGCGKSTLLYLLGLMLTPGSGSVRVDGESGSRGRAAPRDG